MNSVSFWNKLHSIKDAGRFLICWKHVDFKYKMKTQIASQITNSGSWKNKQIYFTDAIWHFDWFLLREQCHACISLFVTRKPICLVSGNFFHRIWQFFNVTLGFLNTEDVRIFCCDERMCIFLKQQNSQLMCDCCCVTIKHNDLLLLSWTLKQVKSFLILRKLFKSVIFNLLKY